MHSFNQYIDSITSIQREEEFPDTAFDYSEMLKFFGLDYRSDDYYYRIGDSAKVQGWVLHISTVVFQIPHMLKLVLALLASEKVPFKMVSNLDIAKNILAGNMGYEQLCKLISIYPETNKQASDLAENLVAITYDFKSPVIPTDFYLGGAVYTRYGSINPILQSDSQGQNGKYIYNSAGKLVKDSYSIPFTLPEDVTWPYHNLAIPVPTPAKKILKNVYKPLSVLKEDVKGNVWRGLYLKSLFRVLTCVIKQGRKHFSSDDAGRDMYDRLLWQYELHNDLKGIIPLPALYDFFQEEGDTYLVMEFIKGISLYDYLKEVNLDIKSWHQVALREKLILVDLLLQVISIIERLHMHGYVHRDIAPGNFLINPTGNILLIDMELAYSVTKEKPQPAFQMGTLGYISPEQIGNGIPTFREDYYGIGALMITFFTGLYATKFDATSKEGLFEKLNFFIGDQSIASLAASCMSNSSIERPNLTTAKTTIEKYKTELLSDVSHSQNEVQFDAGLLRQTIQDALEGLVQSPIVISDDLWYSKLGSNENGIVQKDYVKYGGLYQGLAGPLYLLARSHYAGLDISQCSKSFHKGWKFIDLEYLALLPQIPPGLYGGAAGIAISIAEGIRSGLLDNDEANRQKIFNCLNLPNNTLDLATGIAGQLIATIRCAPYLDQSLSEQLFNKFVDTLLNMQQKDGSWLLDDYSGKTAGRKKIGFAYGIAGIAWVLLDYAALSKSSVVLESAVKALNWLLKTTQNLNALFKANLYMKILGEENERGDERKGIIYTFIKAYDILQDNNYKKIAEEALVVYPKNIVKNNFSLDTGLAALGEIYLEAYQVFKQDEWKQRAEWIAQVFMNTCFTNPDGSKYWKMNEFDEPTADLMTGVSGVIHFLLRCYHQEKIGYRILK